MKWCQHILQQAKALRTMDWNTAFEGLKVHKPQYGIVVHGVSTADLAHTFENEDVMSATIKEWEAANSGLTIAKITRLRRKPRVTANGEPAKTQSVVVHTEDPHAADKCIGFGFFINSLNHKTARYAPQCFSYTMLQMLSVRTSSHLLQVQGKVW